MNNLAGLCCVLLSLFVCMCVCVSCLTDSLIDFLCVLVPVLPDSPVVLFSPLFQNSLLSLSFSLPVFLPLSVMQTHSHLHPHSHPVPPPHSCVVFSPCPLHGFVLLPQCQGPGDEVTLHGRAAGLTDSRPSPPPSSTQKANRPAPSPPPAHYIVSSVQTTSPLRPCKPQGMHTNMSFVGSSY